MADRQCQHDPHSESCSGLHGLLAIMERLRHPDTGCPWDIEQDFASIAPHTIEEAYEVADAIARKDWEGLQDELGDLLFQIVFHAQMAAERGIFTFAQVVAGASAKMVARHPHIFAGESRDKTAAQQSRDWEAHKAQERQAKQQRGALDGVALGLPALVRAVKLQSRAARICPYPKGRATGRRRKRTMARLKRPGMAETKKQITPAEWRHPPGLPWTQRKGTPLLLMCHKATPSVKCFSSRMCFMP